MRTTSKEKKQPRYAYVTRIDFDNAVKQPWRAETCLIAQTAKRLKLRNAYKITGINPRARELMNQFDKVYGELARKPATMRASLPLRIKLP